MQPTQIPTVFDISTVTGVADVIINDELLWVSQGLTPAGRYWALFTAADARLAGVVAEHDGRFDAVINTTATAAESAQDAALRIVAALRGAR